LEQRLSSEEQQKWVTKILGYDFEIVYKKWKKNDSNPIVKQGIAKVWIFIATRYIIYIYMEK
jgi:hypothetical protein